MKGYRVNEQSVAASSTTDVCLLVEILRENERIIESRGFFKGDATAYRAELIRGRRENIIVYS